MIFGPPGPPASPSGRSLTELLEGGGHRACFMGGTAFGPFEKDKVRQPTVAKVVVARCQEAVLPSAHPDRTNDFARWCSTAAGGLALAHQDKPPGRASFLWQL